MEEKEVKRLRYTKKTMLEKALQVIQEKGYDELTVDQICEELGVTKGSFYHHFKSKSDLIFQYYKFLEGHISDYYNQLINLPALEQLRAMFDLYNTSFLKENLNDARVILRFNIEQKWDNFGMTNTFQKKIMTNIIRRGIDEKVFQKDLDPDDITEFIFFNYYGILIQWIINNGDYDFKEKFNHFYYVYLLPILGVKNP
jgi:AcrR family transcriptional regulator